MKAFFSFSAVFLLFLNQVVSQERGILKPDGEIINISNSIPIKDAVQKIDPNSANIFHVFEKSALSAIDTLAYAFDYISWSVNFGFFSQDVMLTWYQAPADLTIKAAGFSCSDTSANASGASLGLRLIKLNWTAELLSSISTTYMGYYPSQGDGYNNADYFGENATGDWIDSTGGKYPLPPWAHADYDLWSNSKKGVPIIPELQDGASNYQWIEMNQLGYEPTINKGEVFAIVVEHNGTKLNEDRFGLYSSREGNFPSWKYYENGRFDSANPGWWVREYTFDMAVIVDLTGDIAPEIKTLDLLISTISKGPFPVCAQITDRNPSGGESDVSSAEIVSVIGGADTTRTSMTSDGSTYCGQIPQVSNIVNQSTIIEYWIEAVDINGNKSKSVVNNFVIFLPNQNNETLFILKFEKEDYSAELLRLYLAGDNNLSEADFWHFEEPEKELLEYYSVIYWIERGGIGWNEPYWNKYREWLNKNSSSVLAFIGDEFLFGMPYSWDMDFIKGSFQYDILGMTTDYMDVNYSGTIDYPGYTIPIMKPIENSILGDELFKAVAQSGADTLFYNSALLFGNTPFLDGYEIWDGEPFITGTGWDGTEYICGHNRIYGNNNHVVVMTFDPLSLIDNKGYWWGNTDLTPLHQVQTKIIDKIVSAEKPSSIPEKFSLSQNYPNPFNPSTVIKFQVPSNKFIKLQVFDMLGREIRVLVNGVHKPGNYTVEFNANGLSSGVYFYTLNAGEFKETKKMILLR
ncbi:MAG: T9SS type A sorting domain-containing protein [Bacteroidota bacterium]